MIITVKDYDTEMKINIVTNHIIYFHFATRGMRHLTCIMLSNGKEIYVYESVEEVKELIG